MTEEMERNLRGQENYLAGLNEGELKGKLENQTLIVKNMLNKNMTDLEIMEITNLSKDELENIKKNIN